MVFLFVFVFLSQKGTRLSCKKAFRGSVVFDSFVQQSLSTYYVLRCLSKYCIFLFLEMIYLTIANVVMHFHV